MDASPLRSVRSAPRDRQEFDRWMEQQVAALARRLNARLSRMMTRVVDRFMATVEIEALTASADFGVFDSIPEEWRAILDADVMPTLQQMYLSGGVTAFVSADAATVIPTVFAPQWATVVNQSAVDYMRTASNRLVGVGDSMWSDLRLRAEQALSRGDSTERLKQQIEQFGFSEYRADMIARTEMLSAYSEGDWDGLQALDEYGPVEKVWVAALDSRTRESHAALHDTVRKFSEPWIVSGRSMMRPHDPLGGAGEIINCRCHLEPLYVGFERPDGTVVGDEPSQEVSEMAPIETEALAAETDEALVPPRAASTRIPGAPPTAKHDYQWFSERIDEQWWDDLTGDRDIFSVQDNNDAYLRAIMKDQGFDATPNIVTAEVFDQLSDEGWTVIHRGLNAESQSDLVRFVDDFANGDVYVSRGMYGNGIYASDAVETAREYANNVGLGIGQRGSGQAAYGAVLDLALHPQARIISALDLDKNINRRRDLNRIREEELDARWPRHQVPHPYESGQLMEERLPLEELRKIDPALAREIDLNQGEYRLLDSLEDRGKIAAMEGYDAISAHPMALVNGSYVEMDETYYVILNRGVVAMKEIIDR